MHAAELGAVLATVSKHAISGIIALVVGVIVLAYGLMRAAARAAMMFAGAIVIIIGILLLTRTI